MEQVVLAHEVDFAGWRTATRRLVLAGVPPERVLWAVGAPDDLFADRDGAAGPAPAGPAPSPPPANGAGGFTAPRPLVSLAETVIQARDPERFALLYRLIHRAHRGEKQLAEQVTDPDIHRANRLAQSVRRDTHKMRAFVRFRAVEADGATRYVAWFEPEHFIVEANAGFFVRRFATMVFSILTPYRSFHWTGTDEHFAPGAARSDVPDDDALERYWRAYYGAIFNPARLKIDAMRSEMPKKYWRNLPEAALIPELVRSAAGRTATMIEQVPMTRDAPPPKARPLASSAAAEWPPASEADAAGGGDGGPPARDALRAPARDALRALARDAAECRRCPLWEPATQTVFGEGPADATMMMVGEQPGDQEDLAGRPFVGPAGQLLDRAIAEAGIDRRAVYVTNAVKHFKFEPRGKRRIHSKPDTTEISACSVWIEAERRAVRPAVTVLLGATAARAVLGRAVTIGRERGRPLPLDGNTQAMITVHPSYLLRLPDEDAKRREYAMFVDDLRAALALCDESATSNTH